MNLDHSKIFQQLHSMVKLTSIANVIRAFCINHHTTMVNMTSSVEAYLKKEDEDILENLVLDIVWDKKLIKLKMRSFKTS